MTRALHLPITLAHAKGAYTVRLALGSERRSGNFVLDTGSSTLAVLPHVYDPTEDSSHAPTSWAQEVSYGAGRWAGPVLNAQVHFEALPMQDQAHCVQLDAAPFSLVQATAQDLHGADGLFGLAYTGLNKAHDMQAYLSERGIEPPLTWPWPFDREDENLADFETLIEQQPRVAVTPLFTALANAGRVENRFALLLRRPLVHVEDDSADPALLVADPRNQGVLVLGGSARQDGDHAHSLHEGDFDEIQLVDDLYYNVDLIALQVGDAPRIQPPPLSAADQRRGGSDAFLDTGCSFVILENSLYDAVLAAFDAFDPRLRATAERFQQAFAQHQQGIANADVDALDWPDLHVWLRAPGGGETRLSCTHEHYWPRNAMQAGQAYFLLMRQLPRWPAQSILGLPLLAEKYSVFDRSECRDGDCGRVRVAKARGADAAWSN
ncbi:pepsin-like aspartic protease [Lysobacter solisilvae (ex Woo and Kim 2020)]|uniref:A1 family peptidase n=1 Tax=Agrilutibacter terrestris TaxID=2865112 RepID=A0A7H0FTX4_9GAMM|nr:pepsin-like aspartic protease [Lysobacter terrestris]QNP39490.1 A1 family peptidase [Lysobacter terrestris]